MKKLKNLSNYKELNMMSHIFIIDLSIIFFNKINFYRLSQL